MTNRMHFLLLTAALSLQAGETAVIRCADGRLEATESVAGNQTTYQEPSGWQIGAVTEYGIRSTYRDGSNRKIGTAITVRDSTTYRTAMGRIAGTATTRGDTTTYRDPAGNVTGTATVRDDTITYRNASGTIIRTAKTSSADTHAVRDFFRNPAFDEDD